MTWVVSFTCNISSNLEKKIYNTNKFEWLYVHKTNFSTSSAIALFDIDLATFWTTFGLCNLSFSDGNCFEFDVSVVELLVLDNGPNNDSNASFFACVVDWFDGFIENISSRSFVRDTGGLFELLVKRDSNGSTDGFTVVVVGFSTQDLNLCKWRTV